MSVMKIGNVEIAYRNGVWFYAEQGRDGTIIKTNNKDIITSMFISQGKSVPYDLLNRLRDEGSFDSEWEKMSNTYAL